MPRQTQILPSHSHLGPNRRIVQAFMQKLW
jgi:hypothetical protein